MAPKKVKKGSRRRKEKKNIEHGCAHINSTFNNSIVTLTDKVGNAIAWSSAGALGFKGSKKGTPFASQMAAEIAASLPEPGPLTRTSTEVNPKLIASLAAFSAVNVAA